MLSFSDADVTALGGEGIASEEDLRYAEFVDFPTAVFIIKRRKLSI